MSTVVVIAAALVPFMVTIAGFLVVVIAIRGEDRHRVPLGARPAQTPLSRGVRRLLGLYVHVHIDEECDPRCPLFTASRKQKISTRKRGGDQS